MTNNLQNSNNGRPVPVIRPPYLFGVGLVAGIALQFVVLLRIFGRIWLGVIFGAPFVIIGVLFLIWAMRTMRRAGVDPRFKPVGNIVAAGPFAHSRNPIYLAFALIYLGIALVANTFWPIIFLPIVLTILHYGVILREERYLEARFGEEYQRYRARIRRWL